MVFVSSIGAEPVRLPNWWDGFFEEGEGFARGSALDSSLVGLSFWPCAWLHRTSDMSASFWIIGKTSSFVKKSFIGVFVMGYRSLLQRKQATSWLAERTNNSFCLPHRLYSSYRYSFLYVGLCETGNAWTASQRGEKPNGRWAAQFKLCKTSMGVI